MTGGRGVSGFLGFGAAVAGGQNRAGDPVLNSVESMIFVDLGEMEVCPAIRCFRAPKSLERSSSEVEGVDASLFDRAPGKGELLRRRWSMVQFAVADFYELNSEAFIANTRNADVSEARSRFISVLPKVVGSTRLLDAGSGSGRDALAFRQLGFRVEAFDASPAMVGATRKYAGVDARKLSFEEFAWEHAFEGIWACASLLHVTEVELPQVIDRLGNHLVRGGAFYASFKLGKGEREKDGRWFTDMTVETLAELLDGPGYFGQPDICVSRDSRPERASEMWVNAVVNKT